MYFNPLPRKRENVAEIDVSAAEIDFNPLPRKRENSLLQAKKTQKKISIHSLVRGRTLPFRLK